MRLEPTSAAVCEVFVEAFELLRRLIVEAEEDVKKGYGGNKAAAVRARKKMQEIKAAAQQVREGLLTKPPQGGQGLNPA
jgi:hypothetical protein